MWQPKAIAAARRRGKARGATGVMASSSYLDTRLSVSRFRRRETTSREQPSRPIPWHHDANPQTHTPNRGRTPAQVTPPERFWSRSLPAGDWHRR
jgi:hypothetical protein